MSSVTPRVDIIFKKIFGVEENKDLLISLINSIVSEEDQVTDITLLNPYNLQSFKNDKLSILDLKAKGVSGKLYNIEIQVSDEADYDKRALYYWAKLYTEQLAAGEDYARLSKAIGIHILNFFSIPQSDKYHNVFHITEKDNNTRFFKDLELHTIELRKFTNNNQDIELPVILNKVKTALDAWTTFLTRHELLNKNNLPKELNAVPLQKALTVVEHMSFTPEEREAYEAALKWLRMEAGVIKKREDAAREEARVEEKKAIAKLMLLAGEPVEKIQTFTGLSAEEINRLKSE